MVVKKFFGKTTREALRQVREELGADALILSNRPTLGGGVEIMAVADADVASLASTLATASTSYRPPRNTPTHRAQLNGDKAPLNRALARTYGESDSSSISITENEPALPSHTAAKHTPPPPSNQKPAALTSLPVLDNEITNQLRSATQIDRGNRTQHVPSTLPSVSYESGSPPLREMSDEIRQLRSLLQSQLASFAWSKLERLSPSCAELLKQLLATGLSASLSRQLIEKIPKEYGAETALKWARSALLHNLKCADAQQGVIEQGGLYALVGPTGVGKTTTIAKLAARASQKFGTHNVALVTMDNYRVGAQDQLRAYGKIIGVPVFSIQDGDSLALPRPELTHRHIVFIDTAGMCQRDTRVLTQTEVFASLGLPVQRILVIAANADGRTLDDVVKRYRGSGLAGCIMTKIDETVALGASLDVIIRNRLKVHYITNGQRVPEDLHTANGTFLIDRALKAPQYTSPFTLYADEFPIMNAANAVWL